MRFSGRRKLGLITVVVVLLVAGIAYGASLTEERGYNYRTPSEVLGNDDLLGETVTVAGVVISAANDGYFLGDEDGSSDVIRVIESGDTSRSVYLGEGVYAVFEGTLISPGVLDDATNMGHTGPSRWSSNQQ